MDQDPWSYLAQIFKTSPNPKFHENNMKHPNKACPVIHGFLGIEHLFQWRFTPGMTKAVQFTATTITVADLVDVARQEL